MDNNNESFIKPRKMILRIMWIDPGSFRGIEEHIILEGVYENDDTIFLANLTKEEAENITGKTKEELFGKICTLELRSKVKGISKISKKILSSFLPLYIRK